MKYYLCFVSILSTYLCLGQTTHAIVVQVKQPPQCTVVSTEQLQPERIEVYPNPASNILQIRGLGTGDAVTIVDQLGRETFGNRFVNDTNLSIDVNFWNPGVYDIIIRKQSQIQNYRVIIK